MSILRKLRRWCPQPKKTVPTNFVKISSVILTVAVLAEILILLIAPITYYALLVPRTTNSYVNQEFPLTNSQIKAAWPNLPTAEEIENNAKNGGIEYGEVVNNSITGSTIVNSTVLNPISFGSVAIPKMYDIFLYEGNTSWSQGAPVWIEVPETYLATSHPPSIPSVQVGFLGTGLPTTYVIVATILIAATSAATTSYLLFHKKDVSKRCAGEEK